MLGDPTLQKLTSELINLPVAAAHCEAVVSPSQSQFFGSPSKGRKGHLTFIGQFSVSQVARVLHSTNASSMPVQVGSDPDAAALTVIE